MIEDNTSTPFENEPVSISSNNASRIDRLFATIIDDVILIAISLSYLIPMGVFENDVTFSSVEKMWLSVLGIATYWVVNGSLLARNGQTIGKKLMGIKIVDVNGNLLPLWKLIGLRVLPLYFLLYVPFVGDYISIIDILFIFGSNKRCLHDYFAGSWVVNVQKKQTK